MEREPSSNDIQLVNFVQSVCGRPRMYTSHGTLAEVYALLIGYDLATKSRRATDDDDLSATQTLDWLHRTADDRTRVVDELLEIHGDDTTALQAIADHAATLPPSPNT